MTNGQELQIVLTQLAQTMGLPPPPPLTPDQVASGTSLMSQLLATLGMAGNVGDPNDMAAAAEGHAKRGEKTGDAITQFPAGDQQGSQQLQQLMSTMQQMPQQVMQTFSGLFQGLSQPLNQAMQQVSQISSQLTSTLGKAGQGAGVGASLPADALGGALGAGGGALGAGGGGAGLAGATTPAGNLGPPPTPTAGTVPMSSQQAPVAAPPPAEGAGARGQMGGGRDQARRPANGEKRRPRAGPHHHATGCARSGQTRCRQTDRQPSHPGSRRQTRR
jgi:hypothetical protein